MKKPSQRARRIGDEIQRELADLIAREVKDPRVGRVTLTGVDVSADLAQAVVRFTHLAGKDHSAGAVTALSRAAGFLRSALAHRLDLYSVPQLRFAYDDSIEAGMHLSQLIDQAVAEDQSKQASRGREATPATPADKITTQGDTRKAD